MFEIMIAVLACVAAFVAVLRRAKAHQQGRSARLLGWLASVGS